MVNETESFNLRTVVRKRINERNQNWLAIICGPTGSGKSYTGLTLARQIDSSFNIDRVVFNAKDLMRILNSGRLKKGDAIMFDEAGVGIPAREWYSISNKVLGYLMQTFRNLNLAVIFTTPNLSYIDTQIRGLFHAYIETQRINYQTKMVLCKLFYISTDKTGKVYYKYPRAYLAGGKEIIIDGISFPAPATSLSKAYEKKKTEYTRVLNLEIENSLHQIDIKSKNPGRPSKFGVNEIAYIVGNKKKPQVEIVEGLKAKFNIETTERTVRRVLAGTKGKVRS